jgi:predicted component of type VI protein secretion system
MDYQLLVVRGRSTANALKLLDGVTTVGRHDDCQIRIKSSQVSRRHCELFEKKGLLLVKDLASSNGTFVNGKKIKTQQVLEPGDELTVGGVTLRVAKVGEVPPIKPPAVPAAGDTAVVEAVPVSDSGDEEFEIDFDDEPSVETLPAPKPEPAPAKTEPTKQVTSAATNRTEPEPLPQEADEAIADFLLDIKLDDDE